MPSQEEIERIFAKSDQEAAEVFLRHHYDVYRYARDTATWFSRLPGEDRWERVPTDPYHTIIAAFARELTEPNERTYAGREDEYKTARNRWLSYQSASKAAGIAAKMKAIAPMYGRLRESDMDGDPRVLWAGGVAYDLRTGQPAPDREDVPHLLSAGYAPEPGHMPLWDAFNAAQWPDPELREYELYVLSTILLGGSGKLLPNFKSDGNLGKTTRLMLLVDLLGSYAEQLPAQLLSNQQGHDEVYLRLKGKRLVYMDETPPAGRVATEKLKHLSGGGTLTGRAAYGKASVTFTMQHTLLLAGNDDLPLSDPNVVRRVRYLPITGNVDSIGAVSRELWDHGDLSAAWKAEAPAVLWSLMERARKTLTDPTLTDMPASALLHLAEAIEEQDDVARFVRDCCQPGGSTKAGTLYESFVAWCQRNNVKQPPTSTKFGRRLNEMGYPVIDPKANTRCRPLTVVFEARVL
jgi:phage/plasmid-associated DNA primase